MGTNLRVLPENYPVNTNMTGFKWFQRSLHPSVSDECSLSVGRDNISSLIPVPMSVAHYFGSVKL